mgnify:CR=1 FL=1
MDSDMFADLPSFLTAILKADFDENTVIGHKHEWGGGGNNPSKVWGWKIGKL